MCIFHLAALLEHQQKVDILHLCCFEIAVTSLVVCSSMHFHMVATSCT